MAIRESKIEKDFGAYIESYGGMFLKWKSPGLAGVPDRIILLDGRVAFFEMKAINGVRSPMQIYVHKEMRKRGIVVYVPTSLAEAIEMFGRFRAENTTNKFSQIPREGD